MFCMNCGKELQEGVKFCPTCGTAAGEMPTQEQAIQHEFPTMQQIAQQQTAQGVRMAPNMHPGGAAPQSMPGAVAGPQAGYQQPRTGTLQPAASGTLWKKIVIMSLAGLGALFAVLYFFGTLTSIRWTLAYADGITKIYYILGVLTLPLLAYVFLVISLFVKRERRAQMLKGALISGLVAACVQAFYQFYIVFGTYSNLSIRYASGWVVFGLGVAVCAIIGLALMLRSLGLQFTGTLSMMILLGIMAAFSLITVFRYLGYGAEGTLVLFELSRCLFYAALIFILVAVGKVADKENWERALAE